MALRRIAMELQNLQDNPHPLIKDMGPVNDEDPFYWQATVIGPQGTPYEDGKFLYEIRFRQDYPFRKPSLKLLTKIYHPCVMSHGGVEIADMY